MQIFSTKDGYFETFHTLNSSDPEGEWKIFASFGTRILGTIYFDVVKERPLSFGDNNNNAPATETFSLSKSSLISVETSSQNYTMDDTIEISGYWKKVVGSGTDNITIQIWSPKNNLILIDQFKPGGTSYSKSIKAGGQMWNSHGEYTVKAQYMNQSVSTTFNFENNDVKNGFNTEATTIVTAGPDVGTILKLKIIKSLCLQMPRLQED